MPSEIPGGPLLFSEKQWKRSGFQGEGSGVALGLEELKGRETGWDKLKTTKNNFFFKKGKERNAMTKRKPRRKGFVWLTFQVTVRS